MSLEDHAVSSNVGFCWALRLLQVLAFTECPIGCDSELGICFTGVLLLDNKTLGRAQDPRAKGAWLSKLTE